jgi:SAM-dependent methyltransferase
MLPSGIPKREDYLQLETEPLYGELLSFSREFEQTCQADTRSVRTYQKKWVQDPFTQWSRRWEYVYTAQRLLDWATDRRGPLKVIDAGSGFTFFPFYLLQASSDLEIHCFDADPTAGQALQNAVALFEADLQFCLEDLENLSQDDETYDAVYSVSVIEHTKNPQKVVDEINRVLKPGGIFVCTFDISFESRSPMYTRRVEKLVDHIVSTFDVLSAMEPISFESLPENPRIVTTQWDDEAIKAGLPWRQPLLVWAYDALRGRFRKNLYRPMTFCCLTVTRKKD